MSLAFSELFYEESKFTFSWLDYTLFLGVLLVSILIGIFFAIFGNKNENLHQYFHGGKNMSVLSVAIAFIASNVSGTTILALPVDVYKFGANYLWICVVIPVVCLIHSYVYLPVFFTLQYTTIYEYLNARFDKKIQTLASFLYTLSNVLYNPIVIYTPALAFAQVSGINIHLTTLTISTTCIFYTTIGGIRAVVYADLLQYIAIVGSSIAVFVMGTISVGGFRAVWEKSVDGHRMDLFDLRFDLTIRDGFWAMIVGGTIHWMANICTSQASMQKLLSVGTLSQSRMMLFIYCGGLVMIMGLNSYTGNIIYAKYSDCDPIQSKKVNTDDQLSSYFIMDVARNCPGLAGIFFAGAFSSVFSTFSTSLNTGACTIYKDLMLPFLPSRITEKNEGNILKAIVVIYGMVCLFLSLGVEQMGGIFPLATTMQGVCGGPLVGLFTLGILFPKANSKGALFGSIVSLLFMSCIIITNQIYKIRGLIPDYQKPVSVDGCSIPVNITEPEHFHLDEVFVLFRLSFWYNTIIGTIVVVVIGNVVSWLTKADDKPVDRNLISPVINRFL